MLQLLVQQRVADYAAWRRVFDDDAEARGDAGLTLLQLWRDADDGALVWMLFEVGDRKGAAAYLDGLGRLHAGQGGAEVLGQHFVKTA